MDIVDLVKRLIAGPLTEGQAVAICRTIPEALFSDDAGTARLFGIVHKLNQSFPQFTWRVALCQDRSRIYWGLTIHDPDPREQKEAT